MCQPILTKSFFNVGKLVNLNLLILWDDEGNESALLLPKQSKLIIGDRYRFYFKQTQRISLGSEYFDAAMSSDCFLGYEQIGEIAAES